MHVYFFFNDTATTEIYTLSLHDALPICQRRPQPRLAGVVVLIVPGGDPLPRARGHQVLPELVGAEDRKSTRLNSSHANTSYAVFCLKKTKDPALHFAALLRDFCPIMTWY